MSNMYENSNNNPNLTSKLLSYFNASIMSDEADLQLYTMFHNAGPTPVLIVPALFLSLIGLIGIPFNAYIIYTTIKHQKSLNRNANYLIALNAFFDMLQLTHPFPFFVISLSGTNFIGTFQSCRLLVLSLFGIQCSLTCMACTGIDRLLSVILPMHYHRMNPRFRYFYCAFLTFLCSINGIWNIYGLWQKCAAEEEKPVTGFIGQIGWDSSKDIVHYLVGPVLISITILCYILIGLILFIQKKLNGWNNSSGINQQQQKLLKSLAMIVFVHVGTLLFGSILLGFSSLYSTKMTWYMMNISLCAILLGASSNAVVLYLNSSEYRLLFNAGLIELKATILRVFGIIQAARIFTIGSGGSSVSPAARFGSNNRTMPMI